MTEPTYQMLDPTGETAPLVRARVPPPASLEGATIGLLSIAKERSDEFLDAIEAHLAGRGLRVRRFAKPTHTRPAPEALIQEVAERCDVVVEALAD